jgi:hypothetical protein
MYPYSLLKDGHTYSFYTYEGQPVLIVSDGEKASPVDFDIKTDSFFISLGENMLEGCYYSGESGEYFYHTLIRKINDFEYGDVLIYNGTYSILETYPCQLAGTGKGLEKVGTVKDFFTTKELTITEVETYQNDMDDVKTFKLADSDGKEYSCYLDYGNVAEYPVSLKNAQAGDTYPFVFNGDYLLIPVAENRLTAKPITTVNATGDADGSGNLDILDIITVNKAILGKETLPSERIPYIDFNYNQVPDASDSMTILKIIVGLENF